MSLILANSNKFIYDNNDNPISDSGDNPSNFVCRFKDPIVLKPNSQIEVVGATLHNTSTIEIDERNDYLEFQIGPSHQANALYPVVLNHGTYTGDSLANEINRKLRNSDIHYIKWYVSFNNEENRFDINSLQDGYYEANNWSDMHIVMEEEQLVMSSTDGYDEESTTKVIRGDKLVNGEFNSSCGQVTTYDNLALDNPHNVISTHIGSRPGSYEETGTNSQFSDKGCNNFDCIVKSAKGIHLADGHQSILIKPQSQLVLDLSAGGFLNAAKDCQLYDNFRDTQSQSEARTWTTNADTSPSTISNIDSPELNSKFTSTLITDKVYIQSANNSAVWSINGYKIAAGTDLNKAPRSWKVYGHTAPYAAGTGTLLHEVGATDEINWRANWNTGTESTSNWRNERTFYFNNTTAYQYYWIEIQESIIGTNEVEIAYLTWINDTEQGGTSLETTANYTGSNGYDTRINYDSSDNYYLRFVKTSDKNNYTWGSNSLRNYPYNHLLIVNKTDKAITNDITQNDFVCILDQANTMSKENLSTYKSIHRGSGVTDDFRLTWDGASLTAFQGDLSINEMEEYPSVALGLNRSDNLQGDYFQFDDINSRTSIINEDNPSSPVQPLSNDSENRRIMADVYAIVDNNDGQRPESQVCYNENLLYKLTDTTPALIQANNREHKTADVKNPIPNDLRTFKPGDTLMLTTTLSYGNQVRMYLSHDTQGDLNFTETLELIDNLENESSLPLTLSTIHAPIIPTFYLNAGYLPNTQMYLVQGKHMDNEAKDEVSMEKIWGKTPAQYQNEDNYHLFKRLPFFVNDGTEYTYDGTGDDQENQNTDLENLEDRINPDGFRGVTAEQKYVIDSSKALRDIILGVDTQDNVVVKLSNLDGTEEDKPYRDQLSLNDVEAAPNKTTNLYQALGSDKVVVVGSIHSEKSPHAPQTGFSNDFIVTLTNMGNVKGYNSVKSDVQKIIGVLPASELEFKEDNTLNYSPEYPLKVDLNNTQEEYVNNFNIQITDSKGKLASNLRNPSSLVLRITEKDKKSE